MSNVQNIPQINTQTDIHLHTVKISDSGDLINAYNPLLNLSIDNVLSEFTTNKNNTELGLNFDLEHPVDIIVLDAYDGAVNLVLNDNKNTIKLINSRFSVVDKTYKIPDHIGYKDTNIYSQENFHVDSNLILKCQNIVNVHFDGVQLHKGSMPCGAYTFYFKLADADGNETEVVAESKLVYCFIGDLNLPNTIRFGIQDENSLKSVNFTLSNIDNGFTYVHVYFSRVSSSQDQLPITSYYKILKDFVIDDDKCVLNITYNEPIILVNENIIFTNFADINKAATITTIANSLLIGNTNITERNWNKLRSLSWGIIPSFICNPNAVSPITSDYTSANKYDTQAYYDINALYDKVGYWPGEIYKIGIVYLFNDGSLSPVFNLQGIDFTDLEDANEIRDNLYKRYFSYSFDPSDNTSDLFTLWDIDPEDGWFHKKINKLNIRLNSKGVFKMPSATFFRANSLSKLIPNVLSLTFEFNETVKSGLIEEGVIGYFFVRQKRASTIIALGIGIGHTDEDRGALPVIKDNYLYISLSFLSKYNNSVYKLYWRDDAEVLNGDGKAGEEVPVNLFNGDHNFDEIFMYNKMLVKADNPDIKIQIEDYGTDDLSGYIILLSTKRMVKLRRKIEDDGYMSYYLDKLSTAWQKAGDSQVLIVGKEGNDIPLHTDANALLIPDAEMHEAQFNNIFTSNEFCLEPVAKIVYEYDGAKHLSKFKRITNISSNNRSLLISKLTNVSEDTKLITDGTRYYSSLAGSAEEGYLTKDIYHKWNTTPPQDLTKSSTLVRGKWGPYVGSSATIEYGVLYNIRKKEYAENYDVTVDKDFEKLFAQYTSYSLICERTPITTTLKQVFGGDCFHSVFTHRVMRNFVDPELKTNHTIIDPLTWSKNYRVRCTATLLDKTHSNLMRDNEGWYVTPSLLRENIYANEVVNTFEIKKHAGDGWAANDLRVVTPSETESNAGFNIKAIFKNDANWEMRSRGDINRADINAVALGQWITFPICSNTNYAFRDVDFSLAQEETTHGYKRSFYPLKKLDTSNALRDSNVINAGAKTTLTSRLFLELIKVPFIKQEFENRIYNTAINANGNFINKWRLCDENSYNDLDKQYGSITKIIGIGNSALVVCLHGMMTYNINSSPTNASELFTSGLVISLDLGSQWADSIILVPNGTVYGVDTVAKKIWKFNGSNVETISDQKIETFLIDNIDLSEFTKDISIGHINVKAHYNAYKMEIIWTYTNDQYQNNQWKKGKIWAVVYSLTLQTFTTFLDWYPLLSENIDNIFFSFDQERAIQLIDNPLLDTQNQISGTASSDVINYQYSYNQIDPSFNGKCLLYELYNTEIKNGPYKFNLPIKQLKYNDIYCVSFYAFNTNKDQIETLNINLTDDTYFTFDLLPTINVCNTPHFYTIWFKLIHPDTTLFDLQKSEYYDTFSGLNLVFNLLGDTHSGDTHSSAVSQIKITKLSEELLITYKNIISKIGNNKSVSFYVDSCSMDLKEDIEKRNDLYSIRNSENSLKLWKHGQAGLYDNQGTIKPTNWYGKLHKWYFEFVVNNTPVILKVFANMKMITNKTAPYSFEYEVIGLGYNWAILKPILYWANLYAKDYSVNILDLYKDILMLSNLQLKLKYDTYPELNVSDDYIIKRLPNISVEFEDPNFTSELAAINSVYDEEYTLNTTKPILKYDKRLNDYKIRVLSLGNDMKKVGRVRGNMMYLEDLWDVEIRPIAFKYYYLNDNNEMQLSDEVLETRLRDKWLKVKIIYSGEDLAIIYAIITMYNLSQA